jgi:hypothetical protein
MEAGADFFFDKHTEFNELFKVIKRFIEESNAQKSPSTSKIEQEEFRIKNPTEDIDD